MLAQVAMNQLDGALHEGETDNDLNLSRLEHELLATHLGRDTQIFNTDNNPGSTVRSHRPTLTASADVQHTMPAVQNEDGGLTSPSPLEKLQTVGNASAPPLPPVRMPKMCELASTQRVQETTPPSAAIKTAAGSGLTHQIHGTQALRRVDTDAIAPVGKPLPVPPARMPLLSETPRTSTPSEMLVVPESEIVSPSTPMHKKIFAFNHSISESTFSASTPPGEVPALPPLRMSHMNTACTSETADQLASIDATTPGIDPLLQQSQPRHMNGATRDASTRNRQDATRTPNARTKNVDANVVPHSTPRTTFPKMHSETKSDITATTPSKPTDYSMPPRRLQTTPVAVREAVPDADATAPESISPETTKPPDLPRLRGMIRQPPRTHQTSSDATLAAHVVVPVRHAVSGHKGSAIAPVADHKDDTDRATQVCPCCQRRTHQVPVRSVQEALCVIDTEERCNAIDKDIFATFRAQSCDSTRASSNEFPGIARRLDSLIRSKFELKVCESVQRRNKQLSASVEEATTRADGVRAMIASLNDKLQHIASDTTATGAQRRRYLNKSLEQHQAEYKLINTEVTVNESALNEFVISDPAPFRKRTAENLADTLRQDLSRLEQLQRFTTSAQTKDANLAMQVAVVRRQVQYLDQVVGATDTAGDQQVSFSFDASAPSNNANDSRIVDSLSGQTDTSVATTSLRRASIYREMEASVAAARALPEGPLHKQAASGDGSMEDRTTLSMLADLEDSKAAVYDGMARALEETRQRKHSTTGDVISRGTTSERSRTDLEDANAAIDTLLLQGLMQVNSTEIRIEAQYNTGTPVLASADVLACCQEEDVDINALPPSARQTIAMHVSPTLKEEMQCMNTRACLMLGSEISRYFDQVCAAQDMKSDDLMVHTLCKDLCETLAGVEAESMEYIGLTDVKRESISLGILRQKDLLCRIACASMQTKIKELHHRLRESGVGQTDGEKDSVSYLTTCLAEKKLTEQDTAVASAMLADLRRLQTHTLSSLQLELTQSRGLLAARLRLGAGKKLIRVLEAQANSVMNASSKSNANVVRALGSVAGKLTTANQKISARIGRLLIVGAAPSRGSFVLPTKNGRDPNIADPARLYERPWTRTTVTSQRRRKQSNRTGRFDRSSEDENSQSKLESEEACGTNVESSVDGTHASVASTRDTEHTHVSTPSTGPAAKSEDANGRPRSKRLIPSRYRGKRTGVVSPYGAIPSKITIATPRGGIVSDVANVGGNHIAGNDSSARAMVRPSSTKQAGNASCTPSPLEADILADDNTPLMKGTPRTVNRLLRGHRRSSQIGVASDLHYGTRRTSLPSRESIFPRNPPF